MLSLQLTNRAKSVLDFAEREALELGYSCIGTNHILFGLAHESSGVAHHVLADREITALMIHDLLSSQIQKYNPPKQDGNIELSCHAKDAIKLAEFEATTLNHSTIGTEHLLLGILREGEGEGVKILKELGCDLIQIRKQVLELLDVHEVNFKLKCIKDAGVSSNCLDVIRTSIVGEMPEECSIGTYCCESKTLLIKVPLSLNHMEKVIKTIRKIG